MSVRGTCLFQGRCSFIALLCPPGVLGVVGSLVAMGTGTLITCGGTSCSHIQEKKASKLRMRSFLI